MKHPPAGAGIKGGFVGPISNQVIAVQIFHHAANAAAQIICFANRDSACLSRQVIEAFLQIEFVGATVRDLLLASIRWSRRKWIIASGKIRGSKTEGLQLRRVHRVDHDWRSICLIDQMAKVFLHGIAVIDLKAIRDKQDWFASR